MLGHWPYQLMQVSSALSMNRHGLPALDKADHCREVAPLPRHSQEEALPGGGQAQLPRVRDRSSNRQPSTNFHSGTAQIQDQMNFSLRYSYPAWGTAQIQDQMSFTRRRLHPAWAWRSAQAQQATVLRRQASDPIGWARFIARHALRGRGQQCSSQRKAKYSTCRQDSYPCMSVLRASSVHQPQERLRQPQERAHVADNRTDAKFQRSVTFQILPSMPLYIDWFLFALL